MADAVSITDMRKNLEFLLKEIPSRSEVRLQK